MGRREELARLDEIYDEVVRDSRPAVVFVEGDAGIGKTRTVREFARGAQHKGADVLTGGCVDLGDEVLPYAPIAELLGDLVRREGATIVASFAGPTADELARLVPALAKGK